MHSSTVFIYLLLLITLSMFLRNVFALSQLLASFPENGGGGGGGDQVLPSNLHLSRNSRLFEGKQLPWLPSLQLYGVAWQRRFPKM